MSVIPCGHRRLRWGPPDSQRLQTDADKNLSFGFVSFRVSGFSGERYFLVAMRNINRFKRLCLTDERLGAANGSGSSPATPAIFYWRFFEVPSFS